MVDGADDEHVVGEVGTCEVVVGEHTHAVVLEDKVLEDMALEEEGL